MTRERLEQSNAALWAGTRAWKALLLLSVVVAFVVAVYAGIEWPPIGPLAVVGAYLLATQFIAVRRIAARSEHDA